MEPAGGSVIPYKSENPMHFDVSGIFIPEKVYITIAIAIITCGFYSTHHLITLDI